MTEVYVYFWTYNTLISTSDSTCKIANIMKIYNIGAHDGEEYSSTTSSSTFPNPLFQRKVSVVTS
jgi:hypothetical protein